MTGQHLIFNKPHTHTPLLHSSLRLPGVSLRGFYLTSKNMAVPDLWLVLITNQMAHVVQGGRPPSSLKSHVLFIVLPLGLSVFFTACCQWFYLCWQIVWWVPQWDVERLTAWEPERIETRRTWSHIRACDRRELEGFLYEIQNWIEDLKNLVTTQTDSASETGPVHSPTYVVCSDQRCYTPHALILLLHLSICCTSPIAQTDRHVHTQARTLEFERTGSGQSFDQ